MTEKKNLCAMIDADLHARVCEERDKAGLTNGGYVTELLTEYYEWKDKGGKQIMETGNEKTRTLAFQVSEELFVRIKKHLERESLRTGRKLSQKDFVIGLIEAALDEAEGKDAEARRESGDDAGESLNGGENGEENAENGQDSGQSEEAGTPDAVRVET